MKSKQNHPPAGDLPKLTAPAQRALAAAGVHRLEQLSQFSENEIKHLHGIGPNALIQLRRALKARGLSFAKKEKTSSGSRFDSGALSASMNPKGDLHRTFAL